MSQLIEKGATVDWIDDDNSSAIHNAAWKGHTLVVTRLLDAGILHILVLS